MAQRRNRNFDPLKKGSDSSQTLNAIQAGRNKIFDEMQTAINEKRDLTPTQVAKYTEDLRQLDRREDTEISAQSTLAGTALNIAGQNAQRISEMRRSIEGVQDFGLLTAFAKIVGDKAVDRQVGLHNKVWGNDPEARINKKNAGPPKKLMRQAAKVRADIKGY